MKYVSGRVKELKVGISSYSEDKTPFSVVGNMDVIGIISATTVSISTTTDVASEFTNINVSGISTFNGEIDSNGRIVGAATSNVIPFLYSNYSDLPSAGTYHGAFAHVHATQRAYFAHGGAWYQLINQEANGTVGTGTEKYDIGITSVTNLYVSGISTYDGNLDVQSSVLITGITTIGGLVDINAGAQANTLKVEDLTDNRVVIAGTGGELEDDANLTFNGTTFNVGSAITMYQATGIISATKYHGDGSSLTGIDATSLKDENGNIKIQANSSGAVHSGVSTFNNIKLDDNKKVEIGSSQDLQLYHNATASYIDNNTGALYLRNNVDDDDGGNIIIQAKSGKTSAVFQDDEGVRLYYNDAEKVATTGYGVTVNGTTETQKLNVTGISTFAGIVSVNNVLQANGDVRLGSDENDYLTVNADINSTLYPSATGTYDLGHGTGFWKTLYVNNIYTTTAGIATFNGKIDVDGGAGSSNIAGGLVVDTAKISDLTNTRVVYAGANGELQDSANLTFNGTTLNGTFSGDGTALLVTIPGISTTTTSEFTNLNVTGNTVLATAKVSDLTDNRIVIAGASGELEDTSKLTFDGSTLSIVGDATFTGNVSVAGTLTSEDKTNIDSIGIVTARTGVRINSGGLVISSGVATFTDAIDSNGGANISGGSGLVASTAKISDLTNTRVVFAGTAGELQDNSGFTFNGSTVTAPAFSGDGSALTGITAGGVGAIGGLTVKDEGVVVGTAGSVSTLDFKGATISAIATPGAAGVATITATTDPDPEFSTLSVTGVSTLGSPSANNTTFINSSDAANSEANTLVLGHGSGNYVGMTLQMASNYSGGIYFTDTNNGKQGGMAYFTLGDELRFYANTSQRLALNSNGTTISNGSLFIHDKITHVGDTDTHLRFPATDTFTVEVGGTERLRVVSSGIVVTGTAQATDFNSTSDIRLKDNIQVIEDPLAKLVQIEGVSFNWKEDNRPALGVIADQVQEILPELVTDGDPKTVNYNGLIGLLIEAVKEQQVQITELKSKLDSLS